MKDVIRPSQYTHFPELQAQFDDSSPEKQTALRKGFNNCDKLAELGKFKDDMAEKNNISMQVTMLKVSLRRMLGGVAYKP